MQHARNSRSERYWLRNERRKQRFHDKTTPRDVLNLGYYKSVHGSTEGTLSLLTLSLVHTHVLALFPWRTLPALKIQRSRFACRVAVHSHTQKQMDPTTWSTVFISFRQLDNDIRCTTTDTDRRTDGRTQLARRDVVALSTATVGSHAPAPPCRGSTVPLFQAFVVTNSIRRDGCVALFTVITACVRRLRPST